jgi:hypothetical protein
MDELTGRLDVIDRFGSKKERAFRSTNHQAIPAAGALPGIQLLQQPQNPPRRTGLMYPSGSGDCPRDGFPKPVLVYRLEQIVEGVHLERAKGVVVVCGHEDDHRLLCLSQRGDDLEAVEIRHLDVEQHHVRGMLADGFDCLLAVGAGRDYFGVRL